MKTPRTSSPLRTAWRWSATVLGALLVLFGVVWMLQGFSILPGTFMEGDRTWSVIGAAVALGGAAILLLRFLGER